MSTLAAAARRVAWRGAARGVSAAARTPLARPAPMRMPAMQVSLSPPSHSVPSRLSCSGPGPHAHALNANYAPPPCVQARSMVSAGKLNESFVTGNGGAYVEELFEVPPRPPSPSPPPHRGLAMASSPLNPPL